MATPWREHLLAPWWCRTSLRHLVSLSGLCSLSSLRCSSTRWSCSPWAAALRIGWALARVALRLRQRPRHRRKQRRRRRTTASASAPPRPSPPPPQLYPRRGRRRRRLPSARGATSTMRRLRLRPRRGEVHYGFGFGFGPAAAVDDEVQLLLTTKTPTGYTKVHTSSSCSTVVRDGVALALGHCKECAKRMAKYMKKRN